MEHDRTLHDLGLRKPKKKKRNRKGASKEPPTSTTLDSLVNRFHNMNRHLPADAPPDTGMGSGHEGAMLEKGDEGFKHYLAGKWREGYPRN
jgi:hypothetical protein